MNDQSKNSIQPWVRTILIFPAFLFIAGILQFFCYLILGLTSDFTTKTSGQMLIIMFGTALGTIITVALFRLNIDKESFKSLGFYRNNIAGNTFAGLITGATIITSGFLILLYNHEIRFDQLNMDEKELVIGTGIFVLVSISEEILVRGYVLNNLMKSVHRFIALGISSVMFSLSHVFNPHLSWIGLINLFFAGILLGMPYIYTQKLSLCFALHFSWNFFQGTILGFKVSGETVYSLINISMEKDSIWNGGKFGFEGSMLCLILQAIAITGFWLYFQQKEKRALASPIGIKS